jgi:hypothetical protein
MWQAKIKFFHPKKIIGMKKLLVKTIPGIINCSCRGAFFNIGEKPAKAVLFQLAEIPGDSYG